MKKAVKILPPILVLLLLAGGATWWWQQRNGAGPAHILTLYGNIEIRDAQLAFQEQERISRILVEEGDAVTQGQVVALQDSTRLKARIREAESLVAAQKQRVKRLLAGTRQQEIDRLRAEVRALERNLSFLKRTYERIRTTTRKGASTEQSLDDARARYEVEQARLAARQQALDLAVEGPRQEDIAEARERLQAAQASLDLLQIRLEDLTLKAPRQGVIQSRILEQGEMAGPSRPVLTLALTDAKWVRAYVPEPDLGKIRLGLQAEVLSDSFPEKAYQGRVGFISPVAEFTPKSVETPDLRSKLVYEVRINVQDPDDELRLGMPVTVRIALDTPPGGQSS
jgi:HlyD family secretion protein